MEITIIYIVAPTCEIDKSIIIAVCFFDHLSHFILVKKTAVILYLNKNDYISDNIQILIQI